MNSTPSPPNGLELEINPEWEVHPVEVKEWLAKGEELFLLDVRQAREWNLAKIEGATLIPLNELTVRAEAELAAVKKKRIVIYCHHGVRSLRAAALLRQLGFANAYSMAGGIEAWSVIVDSGVPRY
jgi:adenylyltransferase/sulfurtransferase